MKKALFILAAIAVFCSCKKEKEEEIPEPEKLNWEEVYSGTSLEFREEYFVVDENTGGLVINTPTTIKILKTTNGGKDWTETDTKLSALEVRSVTFQTKDIGFISLFGKGVFKTIDGGKTWKEIYNCTCGLTSDKNSLAILTGYKTLYSTDGGETFTEYEADLPAYQNPISSFRFGNNVYFYYYEGLIKSEDGGKIFKSAGLNFSNISSITPISSTKWYLIAKNTLHLTEDAGATWKQVDDQSYSYLSAAKGDTLFINRDSKLQWTKDGKSFTQDDDKVRNINMFSIGKNLIGFGNDKVYRRKF